MTEYIVDCYHLQSSHRLEGYFAKCRESAIDKVYAEKMPVESRGQLTVYIKECRDKSAYAYLFESILVSFGKLNC